MFFLADLGWSVQLLRGRTSRWTSPDLCHSHCPEFQPAPLQIAIEPAAPGTRTASISSSIPPPRRLRTTLQKGFGISSKNEATSPARLRFRGAPGLIGRPRSGPPYSGSRGFWCVFTKVTNKNIRRPIGCVQAPLFPKVFADALKFPFLAEKGNFR